MLRDPTTNKKLFYYPSINPVVCHNMEVSALICQFLLLLDDCTQ